MNAPTLSRSLARPPRRSICSASCLEMSMLTPESCNFCLTNESELAVSASDSAIDCSGFDGSAKCNVYMTDINIHNIQTFCQPLCVLSVITQYDDMSNLYFFW